MSSGISQLAKAPVPALRQIQPVAKRSSGNDDLELQIGPWLTALNVPRSQIIDDVDITDAYLSELISGRKKNPSATVLKGIARSLGITLDMLYERPPDARALAAARAIEKQRLRKGK